MVKLFVFVSFTTYPTPLQQRALLPEPIPEKAGGHSSNGSPRAVSGCGGLLPPLALQPAGGTRPGYSLDPAAGPLNLLPLGSGGAEGRRCLVSGYRRIVRVAKGWRVPLQPQTTTRTCITVRTITLQLAWTPLKGLISYKRIEVSGIREDRVSGLPPGATPSSNPCLASLHPALHQPVTTWAVCGVSWQLGHRLLQQLHSPSCPQ